MYHLILTPKQRHIRLSRTQARCIAGSRVTGILVPREVSWERRREKRAWHITISKWRKVIYAKLERKKNNHLERFFFQRKESSPARPEGQNPLSTQFLWKGPTFFWKKWLFPAFSCGKKCTFIDVNLQESLALRRRLHAKETINILHEFFRCRIFAPLWKGGSDTSSDLVETFLTWAEAVIPWAVTLTSVKNLSKRRTGTM